MAAPPAMTDSQAALEAFRRWGQGGRVWHPHGEARGGPSYCVVGESNGRLFAHQWIPRGIGRDWSEAFRDCDERY